MQRSLLLGLVILFVPASIFISVLLGSVDLSVRQVLDALLVQSSGIVSDIVWKLRLPRALAAFACGGLLALAGTLLQVLLRNPLADPYILGVSGGAALGALVAMLFGLSIVSLNLAALCGALFAISAVFGLSFRAGDWNLFRLLLCGVVLASGFGALISLVLVLAPQANLKGMLFWLMGDLSQADQIAPALIILTILTVASLLYGGTLNILSLGDAKAKTLGVAVVPVQLAVFFAASVATASAVILGGTVGFVGLIIPHLLRLLGVSDHRLLIPLAVFVGGSFLTVSDTFARTFWAPLQLPVGIVTALFGVPIMLFLLSRKR